MAAFFYIRKHITLACKKNLSFLNPYIRRLQKHPWVDFLATLESPYLNPQSFPARYRYCLVNASTHTPIHKEPSTHPQEVWTFAFDLSKHSHLASPPKILDDYWELLHICNLGGDAKNTHEQILQACISTEPNQAFQVSLFDEACIGNHKHAGNAERSFQALYSC
jgi:hypothetical protein